MIENYFKLVLVTQKRNKSIDTYLNFIKTCIDSGVTSIQLREKKLEFQELLKFGYALHSLLKSHNIPLIINDNIELALALDAEGVHLGQSDCHVLRARNRLGYKKIIGLSINTIQELKVTHNSPIDYIGLSSIFPTNSKENVS